MPHTPQRSSSRSSHQRRRVPESPGGRSASRSTIHNKQSRSSRSRSRPHYASPGTPVRRRSSSRSSKQRSTPSNGSHSRQSTATTVQSTSNGYHYGADDSYHEGFVSSVPHKVKEDRQQQMSKTSRKDNSTRDERSVTTHSSTRGNKLQSQRVASIRKAIEELNKNSNDDKRKAKLTQACHEFDHWDDARHNAELHCGAANVLSLLIAMSNDDDEIRMICSALEMVFRAFHTTVRAAYQKIGPSIVPWLLAVMKRAEMGKLKHANVSILNVTKIFFYWSRVSELRMPLSRFSGMMEMLIRVPSVSNPEAKAARMRLIANLANSDENKIYFVETRGLLESILRTAVVDTSDKAKEYAATTLMDLAACPDNQVAMAKSDRVLGTMVKLAVTEPIPETREAAISGLQNLAYCQSNRVRLVTYSNGVVLDAMRKTLSTDLNDKARRRAAGTITNMACAETAEFMGNHKGLLETLAVVSTKDENMEVQTRAVMALTKVANSINSDMPCNRTLMDALIVASLSNVSNSVSQVLRVKARDPENRESMARHPGVLDTLSDICVSSDYPIKDRENAMRALMHLTNEDSNRKIMCQKTVLDALIIGATVEGPKWADFCESAVVALERLATEHTNRPVLCRHSGMLVAVARVTEREQKDEDDGKESSHERLAKPLLMSLLLAL